MKRQKLKEVLALLDVSRSQLDEFLYHLSEELEDRVNIPGLYANSLFRIFWKRIVFQLSISFMEQIKVTVQCDLVYKKGLTSVTGQDDIRNEYFQFMRRLLLSHHANNEIIKLIKEFNQTK